MIEHERSYIFTQEAAMAFLKRHDLSWCFGLDDSDRSVTIIEDHYLGPNVRVRKQHINSQVTSYHITRKTGDKAAGYRHETEEQISEQAALALIEESNFCIKKVRKKLPVSDEHYQITMDLIDSPMKVAILEIEARHEIVYPIPLDITEKLFKEKLIECPLCGYNLFNRHIAFCGTSSSGKSESAKFLSHVINTEFQGNSFHVAEFATTFIQKYRKVPNFWEEFFIWHGQHEREHSAELANIVISDCPTFLTYIYLLHLPKDSFSDSTALVLAKMYKRVLFDILWYTDIIFLRLRNYSTNNIRYQSQDEALVIQDRIQSFLTDHNIKYYETDYSKVRDIFHSLFFLNT